MTARSDIAESADGPRVMPSDAVAFAEHQIRRIVTDNPGGIPVYTTGGQWEFVGDPWAPAWTGGFLAGSMLILAERTGNEFWLDQGRKYCALIEPRKTDETTHDIGFLFTPSWSRLKRLVDDVRIDEVLISAGTTMAGRFQEAGRYLCTWVDPGSTFIDVMMNVAIIFEAARLGGDQGLADIALQHCLTSRRYLVRGDGSTLHEGWFDPASGEFLRGSTHQGWRSDSSWARGQAWALYGFTDAYSYTDDERLLETAIRCADFYRERTPSGRIPPNDWDDPRPHPPYESSAAAIAAAGFLRLSRHVADSALAREYQAYGTSIVQTLSTPDFLAMEQPGYEGIICHATYHGPNGLGVDESVMWGDHYYLEALNEVLSHEDQESKEQHG